jgi:hypothetical protein
VIKISSLLLLYVVVSMEYITIVATIVALFSIPHPIYGQECRSENCTSVQDSTERGDKSEEVIIERERKVLTTQEQEPEDGKEQSSDPFILPFP